MNRRRKQFAAKVLPGRFAGNLSSRRIVKIELPEFLIYALQARLNEVNTGAPPHELCSLHNLIESELVSLVSVRDVAELEQSGPGFAQAVRQWLSELRE
jgi:hypothetical protein